MCLLFTKMETTPALDRDAIRSQTSQNRGTTLTGLIYEVQGSQFGPSDPGEATGGPLSTCQSLYIAINISLFHSLSPENYLEFLGGVLPQYPQVTDDINQESFQKQLLRAHIFPLVSH